MRYKRSTLLLLWTWSLVRVIKIFSARCFSVVCPGVHAHMYHVFTTACALKRWTLRCREPLTDA